MEYSHSGDIVCGAECSSYVELNTSYWRVCFAGYNGTKYENETVFKKVSRSRTIHANLDKVENIITTQKLMPNGSWFPYGISVDWNVPARGKGNWRPIKDGDCWERGKVNKIELKGHKNPEDTIKWSFGLEDYVDIDPVWEASVKWHDNCQVKEENGKLNTIIGKTYWVNDSDNRCKKVEEAQSLKNSPIKCMVDFDGIHKAECLDYNLTHRKIRFDATNIKMKDRAKMMIKIMKPNSTVNSTEMVEKAKMIRSFVVDPVQDMWLEAEFDEEVHFGENSTTIQLQDANTENLDDTYILSNTDWTYGASSALHLHRYKFGADERHNEIVIKFNLSDVPASANIDSALLAIYVDANNIDAGEGFDAKTHHIYPYPTFSISGGEWEEGNSDTDCDDGTEICWTQRPITDEYNATSESSITFDSSSSASVFHTWSVTTMTNKSYNDGDDNISIWIRTSNRVGNPGGIDYLDCDSKEGATASQRPYLNVTYTATDITKPTYSNDGHNTTVAGASVLFSIEYNDDIALHPGGQYIFSTNNTGTWINESAVNFTATPNWANVSKTLNSTASLTISYRWYADDNAGNINDTGIFTLTTTGTKSINLSYGPADTTVFRFATCGPDLENTSATPQNQTDTYGIDYVCNNGSGAGEIQIKLSGSLASGWTWLASNVSDFASNITLTTSYQTIYTSLGEDLCAYVWHKANCSYVTENPGAYEMYQIV